MGGLETDMVHRVIDWIILILGVLAVPFAHGIVEYGGLVLAAILLIAVNNAIARKRMRVTRSK
jgi:putative effector of murein hydrolase LrgA (UPF0299 family)